MTEQTNGSGGGYRTPPYVAFRTLNTLVEDLNEHGVPSQIDRSVLRRFSGGVGTQLLSALKSLGLVTDDATPTAELGNMVAAYGTDEYKHEIGQMLKRGYPYLSSLDLTTATPSQFADAFRVTGAKEDVLRKARTFYLNAATYAGIALSSRLVSGAMPRKSPASTPRRTKVAAAKPKVEPMTGTPAPAPAPSSTNKPLEYQLIDLLKDEGIGDEQSAAIWTLVRFLTEQKKAADQ